MSLLRKIASCLIPLLVITEPLGCFSIRIKPSAQTQQSSQIKQEHYIRGRVKSEIPSTNFQNSSEYVVYLETSGGIKTFRAYGIYSAPELDRAVNTGDELLIRLSPDEDPLGSSFSILRENIMEINGKRLNRQSKFK